MDQSIERWIGEAKRALVDGRDMAPLFADVREAMRREADAIGDAAARGESVVPELDYASVERGEVSEASRAEIRRRGCVVVRGVFPETQARDWNEELGRYLADNDYVTRAAAKAGLDDYFGDLDAAAPQIFGVYWSRPQVMARQAESMATTKRFLNRLWRIDGPTGDEFDPDRDYAYADRTRRRAPGDTTLGLSPHMDAGSYERWADPVYREIYRDVFAGRWRDYDPWRATFRTQTREYASPAVCSMFRTFQGWTALTRQGPTDGTLRLVPIANAIAYVLLRALQGDVPEEELCLAKPGRALGIDARWHPELVDALVSIPTVNPGDTVWWHPDVVHAVADEHAGEEYANVIYIGASPACAKNAAYAARQAPCFLDGRSAPDFAAEDLEVDFAGRAMLADLSALGREQMGL